jgi:hypothetical protein
MDIEDCIACVAVGLARHKLNAALHSAAHVSTKFKSCSIVLTDGYCCCTK